MDAEKPARVDAVRFTQRLLKWVVVPIALGAGLIIVARQMRDDAKEREIVIRLVVAASLGGLIGVERQLSGHWAGLRTHMMVALGSAIFIIAGEHATKDGDTTRVIQGITAGIGFLGAGTILKLSDRLEVLGLTTASSIWLAAAVGTTSGLALYALGITATVLSLVVLAILLPLERKLLERRIGQDRLDREGTSG